MNENGVIIVGGGPVGLTLAWRLATEGVPVRLFEAASEIPNQLRASTFHPPTLDLFEDGGVTAELLAEGRVTPTWQIRMHATGQRVEFDLSVISAHTRHPYRLQCPQAVLCRVLAERLMTIDPIVLTFSARVMAVTQTDNEVTVTVEDSEGARTDHRAAWAVGCDGARSIVRAAMGVEFAGWAYPETTILVTTRFPFENVLEGLSGVNYIWKDDSTFSLLRLPDVWRCSFHPSRGESEEEALSDGSIMSKLAAVTTTRDTNILQRRAYRVHRRIAGQYRTGRLILAGDAAHLNSPKGGMGMNGGIHDAFNMADKLAQIFRGAGDERLLDLYERQRLPIARDDILAQADANRTRMNETDPSRRLASLQRLQDIASDLDRCKAHLLRSSMIDGLRRAAAIT